MENTVSTLATTVNANSMWQVFADAIPFISVVVLVSFGFYIIRKLVRGLSKGKTKL